MDQKYLQRKSIEELKNEARNRHIKVPHHSTKKDLIKLLTYSDYSPQNYSETYSSYYSDTSSQSMYYSDDNKQNIYNLPRSSPAHSQTQTKKHDKSFTQNREEVRKELSPVIPSKIHKKSHSHNSTKNDKNSQKKSKNDKENIANYFYLGLFFFFSLFNPLFLVLFFTLLFGLIVYDRFNENWWKVKRKDKKIIKKFLPIFYVMLIFISPIGTLMTVFTIYVEIKLRDASIYNIHKRTLLDFIIVFIVVVIALVNPASFFVSIVFEKHLEFAKSKFLYDVLDFWLLKVDPYLRV